MPLVTLNLRRQAEHFQRIGVSRPSPTAPDTIRRSIAFTLQLKIDGIVADGVMELYFWPFSNAALSTFFLGGRSELTNGLLTGAMKAVDTQTAAAAAKKKRTA